MSDIPKFDLRPGSPVRIELVVRRDGEKFTLAHTFRQPSAEDRMRFWASLGAGPAGGDSQRNLAYLSAQQELYDRSVISVEGYDMPRPDGASVDRWWVELVPLEHKLWAVEKLLAAAGSLERETEKN
mgnify:CR=1 FL=1